MKNNIIYAIMALIIIWAFAYMAYGADTPTREEMKQNKIEQLKETNARIEMNNKIAESVCETESLDKGSAIEIARYKLSCLEKDMKPLIDIDSEIEKEFGTGSVVVWTVTSASSGVAKQLNLRSVFNLWDCRFTNDNHKMPKYKLEWIAYDIACEKGEAFDVSVPDYWYDWMVEDVWYGKSLWDYIIIKDIVSDIRIVYGHTKATVKKWDQVKKTFIIGKSNISGESTWMHLHLEIWKWYKIVSREIFWSDTYESTDQTKLLAHRNWNFDNKYYFTHYDLWDSSQNDSTPNIWASWKDLTDPKIINPIALTVDIRKLYGIKFGQVITLIWDNWKEYKATVHDEMNKRFRTWCILRPWTKYCIKWDIARRNGNQNIPSWAYYIRID